MVFNLNGIKIITATDLEKYAPNINLLRNSAGPFYPVNTDPNASDQWQQFIETTINLIKGEVYTISAQTNGTFSSNHNDFSIQNNCVLWLCNPNKDINEIVSSNTTANGTTFTWNNENGLYDLRVNRYGKDSPVKVWNVKIERGNHATSWTPSPLDE